MRMYEVTPIRIVLPAVGTLEAKPRPLSEVRDEQVIHITGARTFSTTLSDAQREAQAMLAETRARVEGGHPEAILELLDANAAFIAVRWVRETLWKLSREGRLRRRRGRVTGRHRYSPLVVALVDHLIQMGDAANAEQAFGVLEQVEILKYGRRRISTTAACARIGSGRSCLNLRSWQATALRTRFGRSWIGPKYWRRGRRSGALSTILSSGGRDRFRSGLVGRRDGLPNRNLASRLRRQLGPMCQGYTVNRGTLGYEGDLGPDAHQLTPTKPKRNEIFRSSRFGQRWRELGSVLRE
jgi:fatty acid-binding protein DegV